MTVFKCKMCGGDLSVQPGKTVCECEYCGSLQTLPKLSDDAHGNMYDRANHFRRQNEYDKAMSLYEKILNEDRTDAEAYWGIVLCRYGIEYVEDPASHKRIPTINRMQYGSILADEDYKSALEYADADQKTVYEAEAKYIDSVQRNILSISQKEKPFDVFICYKETDANGRRTRDSVLANDIYHQLTQEGLKVFYAKITLEDKIGEAYEPYIFAALNSARVMVVLGTKPEHFTAVWVKNEWSRYLSLIRAGQKKTLIPAYRDMDAYDLPDDFSHLQAMDMSQIGFMPDLVRGIKKLTAKTEQKPAAETRTVIQQVGGSSGSRVDPLLKRAYMFLEDGNWAEADSYCEKVLDQDPENAKAYFGKLMAELKLRRESSITNLRETIDGNANYQKAVRFADGSLKETYQGYAKAIKNGFEYDRQESIYQDAKRRMVNARDSYELKRVADLFSAVQIHEDAAMLEKQYRKKAEEKRAEETEAAEIRRKDNVYAEAMILFEIMDADKVEKAIPEFESIIDWKDSRQKIEECRKKAAELRQQAEIERRKAEAAAAAKKRTAIIVTLVAIVAVAAAALYMIVLKPMLAYNSAKDMVANGKYDEATEAFLALGDYSDASTQALAAQYAEGESLLANGDYDGATQAFKDAGDYSDASTQAQEAQYQKATELNSSKDYAGAYAVFATLVGYKDVDSIIANDENIAAVYVAQFELGKTVTFGNYDGEAIEWLVLEASGDERIMISVKGLDVKPYNTEYTSVIWETCTLRSWLNGDFLNSAFTEAERAKLVTVKNSNPDNPDYGTEGGKDTEDTVWLLSLDEVNKYFDARICYPTQTAKNNGAYTNDVGACWWWLRSPGYDLYFAASVSSDGYVGSRGYSVRYDSGCVRPVVVLRLS